MIFINLPNPSGNRNEYQKQKKCSWGVKRQPARKAGNLTAIY
jgi:hypothetical protein